MNEDLFKKLAFEIDIRIGQYLFEYCIEEGNDSEDFISGAWEAKSHHKIECIHMIIDELNIKMLNREAFIKYYLKNHY